MKRARKDTTGKSFPLSYGQQALWLLYRLDQQSSAYNVAVPIRLRETVDFEDMRRVLQEMYDRHDMLRATFSERNGIPLQQISNGKIVEFNQINLVANAEENRLREVVEEYYHRPFDLENGPVFRAALIVRNEKDQILLLMSHHIVIDGQSILTLL